MALRVSVEEWKKAQDEAKLFTLIDVNERERQLVFQIDGKLVKAHCPITRDAVFDVDTDDSSLAEWAAALSSYALDRVGEITVAQFLDKGVALYRRALAKASGAGGASAGAAAAAAAAPPTGGAAAERKTKREEDAFELDEDDDEDKGDGWGDGDDDFEKEGGVAEISTGESEWQKWHALKKRWEKKEAALRKVSLRADESKSKSQIFSSAAATKIITNTLVELMKNGSRQGFEAEPVDDNIFHWRVRITGFPDGSLLNTDLLKLQAKYGYQYVELEFKFLMDLYPFYPPTVRLVRPRLKNFLMGRIVCCEELQLAKWNPVRDITEILGAIKRILTTFGAVEGDEVNDPRNDLPPYTALEFQLLRLSMLTEITPRIVKTMPDSEQKTLVVPKVKIVVADTFEKPATGADSGGLRRGGTAGWAKGTGYGSGAQTDWDVDAFLASQKKKDAEILEICVEMLHELQADRVPEGLGEVLAQSCLVPFMQQYLENDSITDMERHMELYHTVYAIACAMARHIELARLFTLLPGETKSLGGTIREREKQALIVEKFSASSSSSSSGTPAKRVPAKTETKRGAPVDLSVNLTSRILELGSLTETILRQLAELDAKAAAEKAAREAKEAKEKAEKEAKEAKADGKEAKAGAAGAAGAGAGAGAGAAAAAGETKGETKGEAKTAAAPAEKKAKIADEKDELAGYIDIVTPWKFDEIPSFRAHHYLKGGSEPTATREWVRRLATEYSDLSKSLPIYPDSSIFLRVHASKMAYSQMLICAPDNTPYSRGAFLFDLNFPSTYPNTPPLVNLQTTGSGAVRFNPNLYNCGKVCLSLLGTWRGSGVSENWNPKTSTFLQVAVSIQSLIFVPEPYFNEPGYEGEMGTPTGRSHSDEYNRNIQQATIRYAMIDIMKTPPPGFEKIIAAHFYLQKHNILKTAEDWARTNSAVRSLIPALRTELEKQRLPTP